MNFKSYYEKLNGKTSGRNQIPFDFSHLDCLLSPEQHSINAITGAERKACFDLEQLSGGTHIVPSHACASKSGSDALARLNTGRDCVDVLTHIHSAKTRTYALLAPAFAGQFSSAITPDKLRSALKHLGFDGVIEVALFADILTLKEAIEFNNNIRSDSDFQITSCCCPIWIAMIKKFYHMLIPHMPASVSPMIASGRLIKKLYPDAVTVFIGPCVAKKAEAKEPDIAGAVDYVLTFKEIQDIFDALGINPSDFPETGKDHSSYCGRIYARKHGVGEAVAATLKRINPDHKIGIRTEQADGVADCKKMINRILKRTGEANFFEGMGCAGGCIGGPKTCVPAELSFNKVEEYSLSSYFHTPIDNPYIIELLHRIGIDSDDQLLNSELFIRNF